MRSILVSALLLAFGVPAASQECLKWGEVELSGIVVEGVYPGPPEFTSVAEGDAACDWLREQPYALWRHDPEYRELVVYERYVRQVESHLPAWGDELPDRRSVTGAAWTHLCPAEWELRQPRRNPFAPKPD